ncbi:MAG TPA: tetratricopeptide repeat protein [Gemmatimonadaceae bacterium]|nr:tetratricopeptide repeat protein [Gemmatimonadaceae bacterium]
MSPQNSQAALTALNGVRPVLTHFETSRAAEDLAADIIDLWIGAETSLQALVGNSSLTGQQLVRAARQAELITLDQAHSLLEFLAARDRANRTSYKPTQADGDAALEGFRALESALTGKAPVKPSTPSSPLQAVHTPRASQQQQHQSSPHPQPPPSPYAPPSAGGGYRQPPTYTGRKMSGPPTIEQPPPGSFTPAGGSGAVGGGLGRSHVEHALAAAQSRSRWPKVSLPVLIGVAVVLVFIVGIWFAFRGGSSSDGLTAGIDAMKNGQRERARGEFAKAVKDDPNAPTPHVFLARISRDEGDLASARAQLDTALRLDPKNQIALREMGLVLFASKQYDLARRFFVRAVQANPQDRAAQGYLGCALMRLGRVQEGTNFINKAGNGSWTSCLQPLSSTAPPPL